MALTLVDDLKLQINDDKPEEDAQDKEVDDEAGENEIDDDDAVEEPEEESF